MYRLVGFHGTAATMLKFFLLAIVDAVAGLAIASSIGAGSTIMAIALTIILVFLNWVYIFRTPTPVKFLAPGIVFLLTFVVVPIVYTIAMAGFNFKTGNELSKDDSLSSLLAMESEVLDEEGNAISYEYVLGHPEGSDEWGILTWSRPDGITIADVVLVTTDSQTPVAEGEYVTDDFGMTIVSANGFTMATENEIAKLGDGLLALKFPMGEGNVLVPVDLMYANVVSIDYQYDSAEDTLTNVKTGVVYKDNGKGNFANVADSSDLIYPGWRAPNFPENFTGLLFDEELRNPFIRVFIWTVAFAFLSVFTTFVVGLTLAMALDKPMRGRRIYRSILILPYAIPGFLSILIWRGMFNKDFGIINRLLTEVGLINSNIGWFDEPWTARFVILFVNLWLGFPYMYLISSGALQAIPSDLKEAAAIDGASPWQAFRAVVLPLLLQILNPLLISSFAFNFNNFNIIYLLNAGGPKDELAGERAGATDILISYAYQTAVSDPGNQNFGLASAISLFMFIIVGVLSMWSLRQSKALEEF